MTQYKQIEAFAAAYGKPFAAKTIIDITGIKKRQVNYYLLKLKNKGYIRVLAGNTSRSYFYVKVRTKKTYTTQQNTRVANRKNNGARNELQKNNLSKTSKFR